MYTKLESIPTIINELSKSEWDRLFKLIPQIERTENFATKGGFAKDSENLKNFKIMPSVENQIVWEVEKVLDELNLLIIFDWADWGEGKRIAEKQDYNNRDTVTLLKLISAFIRNNRFCDGVLAERFEDRSIEKILKQIKKNVENDYL